MRYRGTDGEMHREEVEPPPSARERMRERLDETTGGLQKRMEDLRRDLFELANSTKAASKKKLREMELSTRVIQSHYDSNLPFVVQQAEEEVHATQEAAKIQLASFVKEKWGIEAEPDTFIPLLAEDEKALPAPVEKPEKDDYELQDRELKPVDEMTSWEVSIQIHNKLRWLYRMEQKEGREYAAKDQERKGQLYEPGSTDGGPSQVNICYVSFQGSRSIPLVEAREYLKFLLTVDSVDKFKSHYWHQREVREDGGDDA